MGTWLTDGVLILAVTLQGTAALLALRNLRAAGGYRWAWASLSLALVVMMLRRLLSLLGLDALWDGLAQALLGLLISVAALAGIAGLKSLFAEMARKDRELRHLATTDPLTGILNRRELLRILDAEIARGRRYRRPLALVIFDLDHFKAVNDTYGHAAGDRVLCAFCALVAGGLRAHDAFGRMGGEELALVLPETDAQGGLAIAERVLGRLRDLVVETEAGPVRCSASAGVTAADPGESPGAATLLQRADQALYRAKDAGRDRALTFAGGGVTSDSSPTTGCVPSEAPP